MDARGAGVRPVLRIAAHGMDLGYDVTMNRITEIVEPEARSELCRRVLDDLPNWFGRPEAREAYIKAVADQTTFAWAVGDALAGIISLTRQTSETFDIHVMGVLQPYQRQGGGSALLLAGEKHAEASGARFLTVQTVGPSDPDPFYAQTRAFYSACGMASLAEFKDHWGAGTPMLLMGKGVSEHMKP